MAKNKKMTITAEQLFDFNKPKYNGFACGHGSHKNKKAYDRKREKTALRKEW